MPLNDKQKTRVEALLIPYPLALRDEARQTVTLGLTAADEQLRELIKKWRERAAELDAKVAFLWRSVNDHSALITLYSTEAATCRARADELSEYVLPEETSE
jgi:hypothetical protein